MLNILKGKTVVLGITGSIAAYKAAGIASRLVRLGADVDVVMTKEATEFITPLTLSGITRRAVVTDMFAPPQEFHADHVSLAQAADIILIAPATANTIAKLAGGIADDELTCTVLATTAPVIVAPAMNDKMFLNPVTQENLAKLRAEGFIIVGPESGKLACGDEGPGRLAPAQDIIEAVIKAIEHGRDLEGKHIVITAGGTREAIDPARHIGNPSSGKMGYALAHAARDRGADVTLITAPTPLPLPTRMKAVAVDTAAEMKKAVSEAVEGADALIMAAAVADYRPKEIATTKIKKAGDSLILELVPTEDILASVKGDFIRVGFAAESEHLVKNAQKKLKEKNLDLIAANDITQPDSGFGTETNRVTIIDKSGEVEELPLMTKREVAEEILDRVAGLLGEKARR